MNRGRIQAQGGGTEKSESWAIQIDHTKQMGVNSVNFLENQLTNPELNLRRRALLKCHNRIATAPACGASAPMKKSFYDDITNRKVRIDIEVNDGVAFVG